MIGSQAQLTYRKDEEHPAVGGVGGRWRLWGQEASSSSIAWSQPSWVAFAYLLGS